MRTTTEKRIVPVWLVFHDGLFMNIDMVNKDLLNFHYFQQSFERYDTILNSLGYGTSLTELLSEVYSTFRERLLLSTALLMAYVDILKLCDFQPDMICGYGLAEIVVAYHDGCIDQDQCLKIAYLIGTYFTSSDNEDKKEIDLEIRLPMSAKSRLPDQATLIATLNEDTFYIRVPQNCLEAVNKIEGTMTRFIKGIPVYNTNHKQLDQLQSDLRATFRPRDRSFRWISSLDLMHPSKTIQIENRQFDDQYVQRILTTCVDIPTVLKQLPPVKKLHLNGAIRRDQVSTKDLYCLPDSSSLLTALGELYLLSKNEKFRNVNQDVFPLDSTAPSIGHLVSWDHSFEWPVPSWPQFLIPEKSFLSKTHYITGHFSEYYDAVSILLFETISLITGLNSSIFMQVNMSSELHREDIDDAEIQVLWHSGRVSVTKNDDILLFGSFRTGNLFEKFFLDIEEIFLDENIVKYEVLWQNDLLDFMNTIFEYGYSHFRTHLTAVIFDPALHNEGLHRHTFLLAAFELETGICQSGGLVLQFSPPPVALYLKDVESPKHEDLFVESMLVYDISKQTAATVLIYSGFHSVTGNANIGISLVLDERFYNRFIEVDRPIKQTDLTKVLPYLISYHLLHRVLQLQPGQTLLIHPPYDVVYLFLIEMASAFCKHIYVSSWSLEHSSDLEEMFPGVSSVWGLYLNNKILSLTKGLGCDAAITSGTDINNAFITLADNGKLVLLGIPDPSEYIGMSAFLRNLTLHVTEPFGAVFEFLKQDDSALHSELVNRILNAESFQFCDGYSLEQSFLYTRLHIGEFETPVSLTKIQNFFESFEDNSEFVSKFAGRSWDFLENIKQTLSSFRKIFQSPVAISWSDKTLQQSPMKPSIIVTLPESPSLDNEDPPFENVRRNLAQWRKSPKLNRNVPSPLKITSFADE
ncbi:fatty acid synthase-like isoform X1 [Octopus sinensis]|uniref:Fatty acid synthase-like isoform X1 n=2 Tax=Octopus sinensis TaxID=2607531 RepID=A0A7E6EM64_9MOLL|nr:fatty acid synthase-like isoform X1 [Octopus sinensis]